MIEYQKYVYRRLNINMRGVHRFLRKKLNNLRKKHFFSRKKTLTSNEISTPFKGFRYLGYYESERYLPTSNRGLLVYDVLSIEYQTAEIMLEGFLRTFTPMDLMNDSHGVKIFWIELMWRGQIPLYENDHGGISYTKTIETNIE